MGRFIKGSWSYAVLRSEREPSRPCVGLNFALPRGQLATVHPIAAQSILLDVAAELARMLAVSFCDLPIVVTVDHSFAVESGSMVGTVRIEWHQGVVAPDDDRSMIEQFVEVAEDYCEHLERTERHNTIISVDTEEEAERLNEDPEVEAVVCTKPPLTIFIEREKTPDVNAPPARGVN